MNAYDSYDSIAAIDTAPEIALPLRARFFVADAIWSVSSNAEEILDAMQETFQPTHDDGAPADLSLHLAVDFTRSGSSRWELPYFRSLDHLYYGTFGPSDTILVDLLNRRVIGSFSPATSSDLGYWKRFILPSLLGIVSASLSITPLHCACLARNGSGLLISGQSGAGKSTLAVALALSGFDYLSDDCTYISRTGLKLRGWGLPTPVKLLSDAGQFFPQLRNFQPKRSLNGELAFELDFVEDFGVRRAICCDPRWLVFLERNERNTIVFEPIRPSEAAARLASDLEVLPACLAWQRELQLATIDALVARDCWMFRYGGSPSVAAQALLEFCKS